MAITPRYGWEIADGPDAPNVPFALNELALDIEGSVGAIQDLWTRLGIAGYRIEAASRVVFTGSGGIAVMPFLATFAAVPGVVTSHGDRPQATAALYTSGVTVSKFDAGLVGLGSGVPVRLNYVAIGPAVAVTRAGEQPAPFITYHVDPDPEVS